MILYEYKDLTVEETKQSLYRDAYVNFGWESIESKHTATLPGKVDLHFRRDRKILNRAELIRLQRNFEACMETLEKLEHVRDRSPKAYAIGLGLIGTVLVAGAVFAVTAPQPLILPAVVMAVPGFLGWILPGFLYRFLRKKHSQRVEPLMDAVYDEIYEVCEKGHKLLHV